MHEYNSLCPACEKRCPHSFYQDYIAGACKEVGINWNKHTVVLRITSVFRCVSYPRKCYIIYDCTQSKSYHKSYHSTSSRTLGRLLWLCSGNYKIIHTDTAINPNPTVNLTLPVTSCLTLFAATGRERPRPGPRQASSFKEDIFLALPLSIT